MGVRETFLSSDVKACTKMSLRKSFLTSLLCHRYASDVTDGVLSDMSWDCPRVDIGMVELPGASICNKEYSQSHSSGTLSCLIVTARCLLGRVFLLPTCMKSNVTQFHFTAKNKISYL